MRDRDVLLLGAAVAALLLWPRKGSASATDYGLDISFTGSMQDAGDDYAPAGSMTEYPDEAIALPPPTIDWLDGSMTDPLNRNLEAFLDAIIASEHSAADAQSGDAYRTFYGGAKFNDLSDHPVITGEMQRVPLPPAMCVAAGYVGGVCYSSAAGAFQFTVPTWNEFRSKGPYLRTFSVENQREAARRVLNAIGVARLLQDGNFPGAVARASARWASLPGSTAKQGGRSLAFVQQQFADAGGGFA